MAPLRDPRIQQTWNNISHNAETATETAATGIWTFTHTYINPCLSTISSSFDQCVSPCFPDRDERSRRLRAQGRTRGRAELSFDFYDDWDDEEAAGRSGGLLGRWGNDELDRLLAGSGSHSHGAGDEQPSGRKRGMSYGTRKSGPRRKNTIDGLPDPTIIPSTTSLGFLQRLPFKIGGTLRYKPSAADLQEHPGAHRVEAEGEEGEPLIDDEADEDAGELQVDDFDISRKRARSSTTGSGDTTSDSFRSRGDLFPSDGEDDAVPLSDEFAMVLERRGTGTSGADDRSSGKTKSSKGKRPSGSRVLSRTISRTTQSSSHSRLSLGKHKGSATSVTQLQDQMEPEAVGGASLTELQQEEERLRVEEDAEIERKRQAAARLAAKRGLNSPEDPSEVKGETAIVEDAPGPSTEEVGSHEGEVVSVNIPPGEAAPESPKTPPNQDFVPARLPNF
jgi:hypothetical protein